MSSNVTFKLVDYIVMAAFLMISLGIGIFHGVYKKQRTTEEYLYANRQMHLLPVALSLLVTFQSAGSILGLPADVYTYNTMIFYGNIGIILAMVFSAFTLVPLLYPLRLNSAYEYLGRRFNSRSVQLLGTFIAMLKTLLYMSVVLFSPALALEAVAGIPLWVSVFVVGAIGTVYTALGGIKSVIWTDVFQFIILYAGLILILVLGGEKVGGLKKVLQISEQGDRLHFYADIDPRVRHSIWSCVIGGFFTWLSNCCNQSAVQRICAMKSERDAKIAFLLNAPFCILFGGIMVLGGIIMYSYFVLQNCDPVMSGEIGNANQMMPYFVMLILGNIPSLSGIFIAAMFSGSLSSLSSGINALAANTVQDVLVNYLGNMSRFRKTLLIKCIVFAYGALAVVIAYSMKSLSGPVTQIASTAFGACGGPYSGMVFLGAIFPQANWIGALVGGVSGITFNVWLAISAMFLANPSPKSPRIPIAGCAAMNGDIANFTVSYNMTSYMEDIIDESTTPGVIPDYGSFSLYDISYLYFGLTGFLVSLFTGLIVSLVVNRCSGTDTIYQTESMYIIPWLRGVWNFEEDLGNKCSRDIDMHVNEVGNQIIAKDSIDAGKDKSSFLLVELNSEEKITEMHPVNTPRTNS